MKSIAAVATDFDRIAAALEAEVRERRLTRAEQFLLRQVPPQAKTALDAGCGDGMLTRALATRGIRTLGVDVSPGMIALARRRSGENSFIEYRLADIMSSDALGQFDVVISVSAVHHLPLVQVVPWLVRCVAPGGTLLIQDVTTRPGLRGLPMNGLAWAVRRLDCLVGVAGHSREIRTLYNEHGRDENYLDENEVEIAYCHLLPGARVYLHLEWRYTVAWQRP